jgi:thiol:disulfide interchange protein
MSQLKAGAALRAMGALVAVMVGAGWWHWHQGREMDRAYAAQSAPQMAEAAPAPVITPDTVEPMVARHIYPSVMVARRDLAAALKKAKAEHKRVIVDFGGDWCPDCQVLDIYFSQSPNRELLAQNFVKVNVNIGQMDQNLDIAAQYGVPINKGVPALVVLDADGKVLYAQKNGEFEAMRRMQAGAVTAFLQQWKPQRA